MAGINLILKKKALLQSNLHWPNEVAISSLPVEYHLGCTFSITKPYKTYPVLSIKILEGEAFLEGKVYNVTEAVLIDMLSSFVDTSPESIRRLQAATSSWSGEWCLWIHKGSNIYIINDSLGRLPMYWYQDSDFFFAGRHFGLLAKEQILTPNKLSVACLLWSGYLIDNKTLFTGLNRIPGGSILQVSLVNGSAQLYCGSSFNFDSRNDAPLQQQVEHLAHLFKQSCSRIANSWPHLINISLSGGQDSRAVAVGFKEVVESNRLIASSFVMPGSEKDASLAKYIAATLDIPFKSYNVAGNETYEQELLENKMGMNYVAMAFIHDFYKQMLETNGNFLYITGDGGDKALPYLGEKHKNISLDQLVIQLSRRHATTPVATVAALTQLTSDDIFHMIYQTVSRYPEQEINNKSIHFTIYERAGTTMFEGEDRSRYFAWATTPFYDLDFFKVAMQVPDNYKKHYTIYKPFQNALNTTVANIPDASGDSINNWKFIARKRVQELFRSAPPSVKNIVRKLGGVPIRNNTASIQAHQQLLNKLSLSSPLQHIFDLNTVTNFCETSNQEQYDYLKTIILLDQFIKK